MTSASSKSKPISTSRFTLMGLPVHAIVARNTSSRTVNSGVNSLVSTGAMFSMTLCFASTSPPPMMTAPIAPHGISQPATNHAAFISMALNIIIVNPVRTPPPERDEHVVDGQLAGEPHEGHAPPVGEPAASDVRE